MSSGTVEHLTQMANDIGAYFHAEPRREDAVNGVVGHIKRYWTPRMRQKIVEHLRQGGAGLEDLPREAVEKLAVS
ncbi:MAG TPA: formate dehydrogenase subunit delta [Nevskia sp.]|jgi:formate dehydrogenase subunit delta|nr:formate dehydrogenase subunit delta [Nevskia sp.]